MNCFKLMVNPAWFYNSNYGFASVKPQDLYINFSSSLCTLTYNLSTLAPREQGLKAVITMIVLTPKSLSTNGEIIIIRNIDVEL